METTITLKTDPNSPVKEVLDCNKAFFKYSDAMLEFYGKKFEEAEAAGDKKNMTKFGAYAKMWAYSASFSHTALCIMLTGDLDYIQETSEAIFEKGEEAWKKAAENFPAISRPDGRLSQETENQPI